MFGLIRRKLKEIEKLKKEEIELNDNIRASKTHSEELIQEIQHMKNEIQNLSKYSSNLYLKYKEEYSNFGIKNIYGLDGYDFEIYISKILEKLNYEKINVTKKSHDYGVDIFAEKDKKKYAIQCKNTRNILGSGAVQEIFTGKEYYNCDYGIVISSGMFSTQAIDMSKKLGIQLWDRDYLIEVITELDIVDIPLTKQNNEKTKEKNIYSEYNNDDSDDEYEDPLYDEIVEFVVKNQKASASLLQRHFKLGYNRAARVMDLLEERGIVGPQNGSNPREVLIKLQ